jgi:ABC-type cobalamin/Fe3+-siderophores transport system ATPase subunit
MGLEWGAVDKEVNICSLSTGAGKSTLLDILAQRKCGTGVEGRITVNGSARRRNLKKLTTYVPQVNITGVKWLEDNWPFIS